MVFTLMPNGHDDEERAERELARRRARAELVRPGRQIDPLLDLARDRLLARYRP